MAFAVGVGLGVGKMVRLGSVNDNGVIGEMRVVVAMAEDFFFGIGIDKRML